MNATSLPLPLPTSKTQEGPRFRGDYHQAVVEYAAYINNLMGAVP